MVNGKQALLSHLTWCLKQNFGIFQTNVWRSELNHHWSMSKEVQAINWSFEHFKQSFEHSKLSFEHSKLSFEHLKQSFEHFKQTCGGVTPSLIYVKRSAGSLLAVALPLTAPLKYLLNICKTLAKYYDIKIFAKYLLIID